MIRMFVVGGGGCEEELLTVRFLLLLLYKTIEEKWMHSKVVDFYSSRILFMLHYSGRKFIHPDAYIAVPLLHIS